MGLCIIPRVVKTDSGPPETLPLLERFLLCKAFWASVLGVIDGGEVRFIMVLTLRLELLYGMKM